MSEINIFGPLEIQKEDIDETLNCVFVDGGEKYSQGRRKLFSIGDYDSGGSDLDYSYAADKNQSDLELALTKLTHIKNLHLHGFMGGRIDHQLYVLSGLQNHAYKYDAQVYLYGMHHRLLIVPFLEVFHLGSFSLFSFLESQVLLWGDIKYKLEEYTNIEPSNTLFLSNESYGNIQLQSKKPIILILNK